MPGGSSNRILKVTGGGGSPGELRMFDDDNSYKVTLKASTSLTEDKTLILPDLIGDAFINVKDHGADETGDADSTAEINAAISALNTQGGGVLYFPPGTYKVGTGDAYLDISPTGSDNGNIWIRGAGMAASIINCVGTDRCLNFNYSGGGGGHRGTGIEISDISIKGQTNTATPDYLIYLQQCNTISIHDCHLMSAKFDIYVYNLVSHLNIHNVLFSWRATSDQEAGTTCIRLRDVGNVNINGCTFEHGDDSGTDIDTICLDGLTVKYLTIIGNSVSGSGHRRFINTGNAVDVSYMTVVANTVLSVANEFYYQNTGTINDSVIMGNTATGDGSGTAVDIDTADLDNSHNNLICANNFRNFTNNYDLSGTNLTLIDFEVAGKIVFAPDLDTNLYRSAADTLMTDDDFKVAATKKLMIGDDCEFHRDAANEIGTPDSLTVDSTLKVLGGADIDASGATIGADIDNTGTGASVDINNSGSSGVGVNLANSGTGKGIYVAQSGAAIGIDILQSGAESGLQVADAAGIGSANLVEIIANNTTGKALAVQGDVEFGGQRWEWGTAAPGAGDYLQGDIVWNTSPTAGGTIGWVCTGNGSPGTWKTFGSITA